MIERAMAFGAGGNLVGVYTEPGPEVALPGAPAALMWNVGIHHRVGPYRIQVDIARELAQRGIASLRFDLSGMGDSEVRQESRTDQERALDDIRDAMALLEKRRAIRRFVPIGFCSSVDSVHALSLADERVVGACFIEGYAYRTPGFWLHYPTRVLDTLRWKRRIIRKLPMLISSLGTKRIVIDPIEEERAALGPIFARQYPSRVQFGGDVHRMAARGARLLFVYVGGDTDFNHAGQFEEMIGGLPPGGNVEVTYYGGADHTFFRSEDRRRTVLRVADWAVQTFPMMVTATPLERAPGSVRSPGSSLAPTRAE
jgi:dienelactone hydrolase